MKKNKKRRPVCLFKNIQLFLEPLIYSASMLYVCIANPNVFNFYVYLRTHPLLIRHYLASTYQDKKNHTVVLAGFSYGSDARCRETSDRQVTYELYLYQKLYFLAA